MALKRLISNYASVPIDQGGGKRRASEYNGNRPVSER
jgi:hypothetical protein